MLKTKKFLQKKCLTYKCSIERNNYGCLVLTEQLILMGILGIHLIKWKKFKLHIDEPPYYTMNTYVDISDNYQSDSQLLLSVLPAVCHSPRPD